MSPVHSYLEELKGAIANASDCYEVWWVLKGSDTRPKYNAVLSKYPGFFLANIHAQFVAYVVALYRLLETRKDTINFNSFLTLIEAEGSISKEALEEIRSRVDALHPIWVKICILRNEVYAHKSSDNKYDESFKKADITPNQIRDLIEGHKELLNHIALQTESIEFVFSINSREDTISLLEDAGNVL